MHPRWSRERPTFAPRAAVVVTLALGVAHSAFSEEPLPQVERLRSSPVLRHLQPNPVPNPPPGPPGETLKQMYVPPGFQVDLIAAEPAVHQPVAFAFDPRGRLWVAEAYSYPAKRPAGQGLDQLVILADQDGDGRFESRKVFATGLNLVSGFELGFGGVFVGAAPELLFLADRNGDDAPDGPAEVLLDGFGYQDTHECLNSFHWGPDGWLYGIQGVFNYARIGKPGRPDHERQELRAGVWRYHPSRHQFEVFAHGGSNPWGLDHDERGQLFMTHCRSYWGRGGTTHVLQGGQFWNQANANYPAYIVAEPPAGFPEFRNYLLASARYDHGAGGAGAPGTDAIYGGHSHVGTMIYLGDNWPAEHRGRLFTHNLHGHQINQQVNRRLGSGFDTVHAGRDHFFCTDPAYVAIDLQYGPDGAVYVIDWYDRQHCHNPNTERWDRDNGRVYRMQYQPTYRPVRVDLASLDDLALAQQLEHRNEWYGRTARRLLQERALARPVRSDALEYLRRTAAGALDPHRRLAALWCLHGVGALDDTTARAFLSDPDEWVRGWIVRLRTDTPGAASALTTDWLRLAQEDASPVVRLHLASAAQRLGDPWPILEALARHGEDREDRNVPRLVWHALAPHLAAQPGRAFALARSTEWPQLADWIYWYAATLDGEPLQRAVAVLKETAPEDLLRRLAGLALAMDARAPVPTPDAWPEVSPALLAHEDLRIRRLAERIAPAFGDRSRLAALRADLARGDADPAAREHAFQVLARAEDAATLPTWLTLLGDARLRPRVLGLLGRFDAPEIPAALLERFGTFTPEEKTVALNTLTSRRSFALPLLDAVAANRLPRAALTAFQVRQLTQLRDPAVDERVGATWGRIQNTAGEKKAFLEQLEKTFNEAPLWAYDAGAGREHFRKLCASCHVLGQDGTRVGPELTGAGRNGVRYYLENIVDPNAVVGSDFEATSIETRSGDLVTGLVVQETPTAVTLRTTVENRVVSKADIAARQTSGLSLMPEGLLEALPEREQIELLKFLVEN